MSLERLRERESVLLYYLWLFLRLSIQMCLSVSGCILPNSELLRACAPLRDGQWHPSHVKIGDGGALGSFAGTESSVGLESFELSEAMSPKSLRSIRHNDEDDDDETTPPHMSHLKKPRFQLFAQKVVDEVFACAA